MNTYRNLAFLIITLLLLTNPSTAQKRLITKEQAIKAAFRYGLKKGLEYDAKLENAPWQKNRRIWAVSSLIYDDEFESAGDTKFIDARTGKEIKINHVYEYCLKENIGGKIERTIIHEDIPIESLPIVKTNSNKKLTPLTEYESHPVFSDNDQKIAFEYGFRKIGVINVDGTDFKTISEEAFSPQWLDNDWILYCRDFEHIYKKNIHTNEEIRITQVPYRYDRFQLSPDKKWILYESLEMWPTYDSSGNQILYVSTNGQGMNLCILSIDGKVKKFFRKEWVSYNSSCWTANSDSIIFTISGKKYVATNFSDSIIDYTAYHEQENLCLSDYKKVVDGTFPLAYHCQILEIDKSSLSPVRILLDDIARYKEPTFSHHKDYLVYSITDKTHYTGSLWIKKLKTTAPQGR